MPNGHIHILLQFWLQQNEKSVAPMPSEYIQFLLLVRLQQQCQLQLHR